MDLAKGVPNDNGIIDNDEVPFDEGNGGRVDKVGDEALGGEIKVLVNCGEANLGLDWFFTTAASDRIL